MSPFSLAANLRGKTAGLLRPRTAVHQESFESYSMRFLSCKELCSAMTDGIRCSVRWAKLAVEATSIPLAGVLPRATLRALIRPSLTNDRLLYREKRRSRWVGR